MFLPTISPLVVHIKDYFKSLFSKLKFLRVESEPSLQNSSNELVVMTK